MIKEAMLYEKLDDQRVHCNLCAHRCTIKPDRRGICGVRENREGVLYSLVYGTLIAEHIDPIEKKTIFSCLSGLQLLFHCHRRMQF
jgi:pyruvate formate lyase activating enzyme